MKIETDITLYVVFLTYVDSGHMDYIGVKPTISDACAMATNYVGTYVPAREITWDARQVYGYSPNKDKTQTLIFRKEVL